MNLLKIEPLTTKNAKIARILFMVMTVLFAVYMCLLCYNDARAAMSEIKIRPGGIYELVFTGYTPTGILYIASMAFYILAGAAILLLCLRGTRVGSCIAAGLAVGGALFALFINTDTSEYIVCKYNVFFFLHHKDIAGNFVYLKPSLVALTIAAATYFLSAHLTVNKKESV